MTIILTCALCIIKGSYWIYLIALLFIHAAYVSHRASGGWKLITRICSHLGLICDLLWLCVHKSIQGDLLVLSEIMARVLDTELSHVRFPVVVLAVVVVKVVVATMILESIILIWKFITKQYLEWAWLWGGDQCTGQCIELHLLTSSCLMWRLLLIPSFLVFLQSPGWRSWSDST